jgi:hypothetical protein
MPVIHSTPKPNNETQFDLRSFPNWTPRHIQTHAINPLHALTCICILNPHFTSPTPNIASQRALTLLIAPTPLANLIRANAEDAPAKVRGP